MSVMISEDKKELIITCKCGCHDTIHIKVDDEDKDAKSYAGKIQLSCSAYGGMCNYNFKKFFDPKEIDCEIDLEIQEKLLKRINWLIDERIIEISK